MVAKERLNDHGCLRFSCHDNRRAAIQTQRVGGVALGAGDLDDVERIDQCQVVARPDAAVGFAERQRQAGKPHERIGQARHQRPLDVADQVAEGVDRNHGARNAAPAGRRRVQPARYPVRCRSTQSLGAHGARGQQRGGRCEDVAAVKRIARRRDAEGPKSVDIEVEDSRRRVPFEYPGQQTVVRCQENMAVRLDEKDSAFGADAWIDDRDVYGAGWKIAVRAIDPEAGLGRPLRRNVVRQIDDLGVPETTEYGTPHHAGERSFVPEVGRHRDYAARGLHVDQREADASANTRRLSSRNRSSFSAKLSFIDDPFADSAQS